MSGGKKTILLLIILIVLGAAAFAFYWFYIRKSPLPFTTTDTKILPLSQDEKDTSKVTLADLIVSFDDKAHTVQISGTATNNTNKTISANMLATLYRNVNGKQVPVTTYMITIKNVSAHQALTYNASESYSNSLDTSKLSLKTQVVGVFS